MKGYPIKYKDFLEAIRVGNYTCFYTILDDRVHLEMNTEHITFCTQKFIESIKDEMESMGDNYTGDSVKMFLRRTLGGITQYRYYPTEDEIHEIKKIKLYDKAIIEEVNFEENIEVLHDKIVETDTHIKTYKDNKLVLIMEKQ